MTKLIIQAREFAIEAHKGQRRKYIQEPYVNHPIRVAASVSEVEKSPKVIAAALLHDVIEDTRFSLDDVEDIFGYKVAELVNSVTNVARPEHGNRAERKFLESRHLLEASSEGKTIKLADMIDNMPSIIVHDPDFASVYIPERKMYLGSLHDGNTKLFNKAKKIINQWEKSHLNLSKN